LVGLNKKISKEIVIFLVSFINIFISYSQSLIIVDRTSKTPISYATVFVDTIGQYSDKNGKINLNYSNFEKININHIGYTSLELAKIDLKDLDTIFLEPKVLNLDEVILYDKSDVRMKLLKHKPFYGIILFDNSETISCFCSKKGKSQIVKELNFNLDVVFTEKYLINDTVNHTFNLKIYDNKNYKPFDLKRLPLTKTILEKDFRGKRVTLSFDFNINPLIIDENGICFGLEHITFRNDYYPKKYPYISSSFSKKSKYFKAKTYIKYPLAFKDELKEVEEVFKIDEPIFLVPDVVIYK